LKYFAFTTGSCGNAYAFYDGKDAILVDIGVTRSCLIRKLSESGIPIDSIRALFLTHMHPDHSKGAGVFNRATGIKVRLSSRALIGERKSISKLSLTDGDIVPFEYGERLSFGSFLVIPFQTVHDSAGSAGFRIEHPDGTAFLLTDTGRILSHYREYAKGADVLFVEANYDEVMLEKGPYSVALKGRIRSEYGHLSNDDAVSFSKECAKIGSRVYFVHPSANNNSPEKARSCAERGLSGSGISFTVLERGQGINGEING